MKTWKVIELGIKPANTIGLCCPHCGTDANIPIARTESPVIASIGLGLIFDDPAYKPQTQVLPTLIKCRYCRRVFEYDRKEAKNGQVLG